MQSRTLREVSHRSWRSIQTIRTRTRTTRSLLFASVGALALLVPSIASGSDWPQFHFDAGRSGFNASEATLSASNLSQLHLGWQTTISNAPLSPPVVSGGTVYVGSNDSNLYALNASTGAIRWRGATGASIPFSPAVDGSRVFVGSDDGNVYAFPTSCATPCLPLWTTATGARISTAPAVSNGVVYVGAGSNVWALDGATGTVLWQAPLFNLAIGVAVANGVVYATDGSLFAFPVSCSTPCARLWLGQSAGTLPVVGSGAVFSDARYVNNAFNVFPASASCSTPCPPLWTGLTNSGTYHGAAVAGSTVYLPEGDGTLAAFPVACSTYCSPSWTVFIGGFVSDPSIANGVVYVGTDNAIDTFDAATGANLFNIPTGAPTQPPAIANGAVYATTFDFSAGGRVSGFALSSVDTTPPVITVPGPITVDATSPSGAVVTYSVSATDPDDPVASLSCVPASGSTFLIGTTTVTCTATDTHGNTSSATFTVHVKGAAEQLADLATAVTGVGSGTSLADKVSQAQAYLSANDVADACATLNAFVNEVKAQTGRTIASGQAATLIATAQRIEAVLGC
jgi:outer membrane protein assembly factor BamB